MAADGENKLTLVERIARALVLLAFPPKTSEADCRIITQWFYSSVSEASLRKTGILQWLSGDWPPISEDSGSNPVSVEAERA